MEGNSQAADAAVSAVFTTCTVDSETIGGVVTINIAGELDMADADRVGQILADAARTATTSVRRPARPTSRSQIRRRSECSCSGP